MKKNGEPNVACRLFQRFVFCIFLTLLRVFSKTLSSIDKWGDQLKTTKRGIRDFMILELKGIK